MSTISLIINVVEQEGPQPTEKPSRWRFAARIRLTVWASLIICLFGTAGTMYSGPECLKVDYPGSTVPGELPTPITETLWIPDGVPLCAGSSYTSTVPEQRPPSRDPPPPMIYTGRPWRRIGTVPCSAFRITC